MRFLVMRFESFCEGFSGDDVVVKEGGLHDLTVSLLKGAVFGDVL